MTLMDTAPITTAAAVTAPSLYVLTNGTLASIRQEDTWYLLDTSPGARAPVLRLAGDTDDEVLEPHICRSID